MSTKRWVEVKNVMTADFAIERLGVDVERRSLAMAPRAGTGVGERNDAPPVGFDSTT